MLNRRFDSKRFEVDAWRQWTFRDPDNIWARRKADPGPGMFVGDEYGQAGDGEAFDASSFQDGRVPGGYLKSWRRGIWTGGKIEAYNRRLTAYGGNLGSTTWFEDRA